MVNSKGQESAPFELLIAVIIMGFVMVMGMQAMTQLARQQCVGKIDKTMEDFRIALEQTVNQHNKTNVDFTFDRCFKIQEVRLKQQANAKLCNSICHGSRELCVTLEFMGSEPGTYSNRSCVNISYLTSFEFEPGSPEESDKCAGDNYEVVNPYAGTELLPEGRYILTNVRTDEPFPRVLLCRKKR